MTATMTKKSIEQQYMKTTTMSQPTNRVVTASMQDDESNCSEADEEVDSRPTRGQRGKFHMRNVSCGTQTSQVTYPDYTVNKCSQCASDYETGNAVQAMANNYCSSCVSNDEVFSP